MSVNHDDVQVVIDVPECRICYETEDTLFRPCPCRPYVHRSCLNKWLETSRRDDCEICHYRFKYGYDHKLLGITEWYFNYIGEVDNLFYRFFHIFMINILVLNVIAGIIYGCDTARKWADITGIHYDREYRVYYGTVFLFWYMILELTIWYEIVRMGCDRRCRYMYEVACKVKKPHIILFITVGYSAILYGTINSTVFLDIVTSILFLFAHYEIHIFTMHLLFKDRVKSVIEYSP